jgi:hypothetical protein
MSSERRERETTARRPESTESRGGYPSSTKTTSQLKPPPQGPAPGAKSNGAGQGAEGKAK